MHPRVSVSAISSFRLRFDECLSLWQRHGIANVGLAFRQMDDHLAEAARTRDAGLRVSSVLLPGAPLWDRTTWAERRDTMLLGYEVAAITGASTVAIVTGSAGAMSWEDAADAFAELIEPVLAQAPTDRVPLVVEHTHALRADIGFLHSLRDTVDLAQQLGIGALVEVNACWTERELAATFTRGVVGATIGLVQVSDYVIGTTCTPDRAVPGDGDLPLARLLGQLEHAGYEGWYEIELVGPRIEDEGYDTAIPRAVSAVEQLLEQVSR
ncbi:MAG TPA: TIM barrel protein [Mycobacteriales bacterium]|nr:TIM barrel protein [Mycobacteriales bacterium]